MRRVPTLLVTLLLLASAAWAQAPATMPVQMNLTDAQGAAVTGTVTVSFSIYDTEGVGTGSELWGPEDHTVTTSDGVISVMLGDGDTPVPIDPRIFDGSVLFLSVIVDGAAEMDPRLPISSSAYAFSSLNADTVDGFQARDFIPVVTRIVYNGSNNDASVTGTYELLRSIGNFTKQRADTDIVLTWVAHSTVTGTVGQSFCEFQLRIDNRKDTGSTNNSYEGTSGGSAVVYGDEVEISTSAVFRGLGAGSHSLSIWLRGSASNCALNKGNFGQNLIVEEVLTDAGVPKITVIDGDGDEDLEGGVPR